MDHPAYRLAVDVCKATSDKLQGPVAQHFTDIISQHRPDDDSDDELDDVKASHDLVIQLHRSVPALLNAVVPQLGEELAVDNEQMRILATRTLGTMFAFEPHVATKYPATWKSWTTRSRDKSANVRVTFVEQLRSLMSKHNSLGAEVERKPQFLPTLISIHCAGPCLNDLSEALEAKMLDGDDKVRAAVCKVYAHLDYEAALHYVSTEQLKRLAERMLDTKVLLASRLR
jgi:sister-chromatid-cohesion protein PDS5